MPNFALQIDIEGNDQLSRALRQAQGSLRRAGREMDQRLEGVERGFDELGRGAESAGRRIRRAMRRANETVERHKDSLRRAGAAVTAFGAAGVFMGQAFVRSALEQQRALNVVRTVVENTGASWQEYRAQVVETTAALQRKTNFGDEVQLRVLSRMIPILGDTEKALQALPLVLDAASARGTGASEVATTLTRALSGMTQTAESVGIEFEKTASFEERLAQATAAVGGTAEANADSFTQLSNVIGDLKEVMGFGLLPILRPVANALKSVVEAINEAPGPIKTTASVTFGLVTAMAALSGPGLLIVGFLPNIARGMAMVRTATIAVTAAIRAMSVSVYGLRTALMTTGLGALLVGGGFLLDRFVFSRPQGPGPGALSTGRGGGNTININNPQVREDSDLRRMQESVAQGLRRAKQGAFGFG